MGAGEREGFESLNIRPSVVIVPQTAEAVKRGRKMTEDIGKDTEQLIIDGDLGKLSPEGRVGYYNAVCKSLGLNPLTRPFAYIILNGKLTLYALRTAADQLRKRDRVSAQVVSRDLVGDVYVVIARATDATGRYDESMGAVAVGGLRGDMLGNAYMKAETKAKRRATLSLVGLGWMDESEMETVKDAKMVRVTDDGEIVDRPQWPAVETPATEVAPTEAPRAQPVPKPGNGNGKPAPDWTAFWVEARKLGYSHAQVHESFGVETMKEWLDGHPTRTLRQALDELAFESEKAKETAEV